MKKDGRLIKKTLPVKDDLSVLVCHPSFRFSTEEARRLLPKTVPMGKAVSNIAGASLFIASVLFGDYSLLSESLDDSLHQPYRKTLIRGYSITEKNGKIIKSSKELKVNDDIKLRFVDGEVKAKVLERKN